MGIHSKVQRYLFLRLFQQFMYLVVLIIDETFKFQESMKKLFVSCSCFLVTALLSVQADNKMDKQTDVVVEECVCQGPRRLE